MLFVKLSSSQFEELALSGGWRSSSVSFLRLVFVDGVDIPDASKHAGISTSRGYNLASDFRKRYTSWLEENQLHAVLVFTPNSA